MSKSYDFYVSFDRKIDEMTYQRKIIYLWMKLTQFENKYKLKTLPIIQRQNRSFLLVSNKKKQRQYKYINIEILIQ